MTPHVSKRLIQAAAVLSSVTLLAGCSGSDADTATSAASSAVSAASSAVSSAADEATSAAAEASSAAEKAADIADEAWNEALEQAEDTIPATSVVSGSDLNVHIDGDCDSLEISGADNTIVAEGVGALTVSGSGNTIYVKNPVSINLIGADNTIVWNGTEEPTVQDAGADNTVRQAS